MPISITINDAGQAVLEIEGAEAEVWKYRFRLIPPGLSAWAIEMTRADTDSTYRVEELSPGRWTCSCPAEMYRKRGAEHCKHQTAARLLRAWLNDFLHTKETDHERNHARTNWAG